MPNSRSVNKLARIRRRLIAVGIAFVVGALLGTGLATVLPPRFAANVTFLVGAKATNADETLAATAYVQDRIPTYVDLLTTHDLADRVVRAQRLPLTAADVAQKITAQSGEDSSIILVTVADDDPDVALRIARGLTTAFRAVVADIESDTAPFVEVTTVSPPSLRGVPVGLGLLWYALWGGLILAALVAATILLWALFDVIVRTPESAAEITDLPVLVSIPFHDRVQDSPLVIGDEAHTPRADAFRDLRSSLSFVSATQQTQVIMFTSSTSGEGKTATAINLAIMLTENRPTVLLIDADMRRPRVSHYLDVGEGLGLSDVLAHNVDLDDAIHPWGESGLSVLPAGRRPPNPAQLLGSSEFAALIDAARAHYDHIIVDLPPASTVRDPILAGDKADAVLVVVRMGRTRQPQLRFAIDRLKATPIAGLVVIGSKSTVTAATFTDEYSPGQG